MRQVCWIALSAALTLGACGSETTTAETFTAEAVTFERDFAEGANPAGLRDSGGLILSSTDSRFGGWSALEISASGTRLLAISDSASWMTADLIYDETGRLSGATQLVIEPVRDGDGEPLRGMQADAEGLADLGEGRYAVSFEREHRIEVYPLGEDWSGINEARPAPFPAIPGAARLRANAGAEALARIGDTLWVAIEDPIVEGQPHTLWRYELTDLDATPVSRQVTLTPGYGLTALGGDGEGGLLVVERTWRRGVGNTIRLGRFEPGMLEDTGGPITPVALATLDPGMVVDNFEAIAVAEVAGERRIFILSDDNFNDAQSTLLLSFSWPEDD